jgi:3D (Asp-Asp-Asp) domain-containing protein
MLQYTETNKKRENMKNILLLTMLALSICTTLGSAREETYWARITYYHDGSGKVADPKIKRAIRGVSLAAHPKFPFGTKVSIPALRGKLDCDDEFVVHDRGPAVTSKKAARGKAFVFDVYVKNEKEVQAYAKANPAYMKVIVHK